MKKPLTERKVHTILTIGIVILCILGAIVIDKVNKAAEEEQPPAAVPAKIKIENPTPCNEGSINIYTPDGKVLGYYGTFIITNDGYDGHQIILTLNGYLVGEDTWQPAPDPEEDPEEL